MAARYWVGGTASWDGTAGTKWATTSGGAGGAAVPTTSDDVFFDAASGTNTVTVTASSFCASLNFTGFTGTFAGSSQVTVYGNTTLASSMTWTYTGTLNYIFGSIKTFTSNGKAITSSITIAANGAELSLADALSTTGAITLTQGTFTTNNYNVTATSLASSNSNTRTINLGSSTVTLTTSSGVNFSTSTNLTFNAGTSSIVVQTSGSAGLDGGSKTFYNVQFTATASNTFTITGANTYNDLSFAGRASAGVTVVSFNADQTINGILTLSAGTNATMRTFVRSDTIGTTRTLTCAAVASLTDIDFRDITIAGAAAPVSGTRLGDCKGNSGITFDAPKTVYFVANGSSNWNTSLGWSNVNVNGSGSPVYFPLAQDTATFPTYPPSGSSVTISANYNIGTIDMSARTSNTMTLATGTTTPAIYGNWINGTGTTITGTGSLTFAGRGSQTITSAGKTFTQAVFIITPGGSVTLQDAYTGTATSNTIQLQYGTFDANGYNVTLSGPFLTNYTNTRTAAIGSGTWTLSGATAGGVWNASTTTNLTVTGTGTISLTSASAKTFAGGGANYSGITVNQGGAGALTISGSNTFKDITNTYSATGATSILFTAGTTQILSQFTATGASGKVLTLGATTTSQATLQKSSSWLMGANSTNGGNNTGLTFTAGGGIDYLSVSYINGTVVAPPATSTGNFLFFF